MCLTLEYKELLAKEKAARVQIEQPISTSSNISPCPRYEDLFTVGETDRSKLDPEIRREMDELNKRTYENEGPPSKYFDGDEK
jgi:hypothetical protein